MPAWPADWFADGPAWGIAVLGIVSAERALRADEHDCLAKLRAQGVIQ